MVHFSGPCPRGWMVFQVYKHLDLKDSQGSFKDNVSKKSGMQTGGSPYSVWLIGDGNKRHDESLGPSPLSQTFISRQNSEEFENF